ncbi:MAG: hypothetical protein ACKVQJ_12685 [Pyrinomonadaceae bacterium]
MKATCIEIAIFIATATSALGQNSELKKEQIQSIQKLINTFKTNNETKIADAISYPLGREYPLKYLRTKKDFIQRFDEIFDKGFLDHVVKSNISDWSEVGWRGIMFDSGTLWLGDDGKIMTVNYQSPKEKQLLAAAILSDKNQLPKALQDFERPVYLIFTKTYKIRVDEKSEGIYRYSAWKIKNQKSEPDIIIGNGVLEFQGSGGNQTITFKNNGFTYIVSIYVIGSVDTPEATLEVSKLEKIILTEDGNIKRN